ncbi:hypothetical protein RRG08_007769 [Elysia crispata]|uniref:Uncharacterized protein n=1 Tax=Elysia crispata TaxID=231223 RepID=A0AAE1B2E8_9GAST|nr:hypothetical protein RRG08_007769 [Elysia crispata]
MRLTRKEGGMQDKQTEDQYSQKRAHWHNTQRVITERDHHSLIESSEQGAKPNTARGGKEYEWNRSGYLLFLTRIIAVGPSLWQLQPTLTTDANLHVFD